MAVGSESDSDQTRSQLQAVEAGPAPGWENRPPPDGVSWACDENWQASEARVSEGQRPGAGHAACMNKGRACVAGGVNGAGTRFGSTSPL